MYTFWYYIVYLTLIPSRLATCKCWTEAWLVCLLCDDICILKLKNVPRHKYTAIHQTLLAEMAKHEQGSVDQQPETEAQELPPFLALTDSGTCNLLQVMMAEHSPWLSRPTIATSHFPAVWWLGPVWSIQRYRAHTVVGQTRGCTYCEIPPGPFWWAFSQVYQPWRWTVGCGWRWGSRTNSCWLISCISSFWSVSNRFTDDKSPIGFSKPPHKCTHD